MAEIVAGCWDKKRDADLTFIILPPSRNVHEVSCCYLEKQVFDNMVINKNTARLPMSNSDGNSSVFKCCYTSVLPARLFFPMSENQIKTG